VIRLNYGPGSLSRAECPACGPSSLHKYGACIHCKRQNYGANSVPCPYRLEKSNGDGIRLRGTDQKAMLSWKRSAHSHKPVWMQKELTYKLRQERLERKAANGKGG
jgi:hypothetical protein